MIKTVIILNVEYTYDLKVQCVEAVIFLLFVIVLLYIFNKKTKQ
jgi:hypothetical protein